MHCIPAVMCRAGGQTYCFEKHNYEVVPLLDRTIGPLLDGSEGEGQTMGIPWKYKVTS